MTIDGRTYSLQTNLSFESELPNLYFGQEYCAVDADDIKNWNVLSTQIMTKMSGMLAIAEKGCKEFCFIIKPSPGSRKQDIISSK